MTITQEQINANLQRMSERGVAINTDLLNAKVAAYEEKAKTEKGQSSSRRAKILLSLAKHIDETGRIHPRKVVIP